MVVQSPSYPHQKHGAISVLFTPKAGVNKHFLQSGASSQAKIGGAYFSGVTGSIQDPIAVPGPCEVTEF